MSWSSSVGPDPNGTEPTLLFCENETNTQRLYGTDSGTPYPKDGINDHVISGAPTVNPDQPGTKCAFWYQVTVPARRHCRAAPPPASGRHGAGAIERTGGTTLSRSSPTRSRKPTNSTPN